ncbi:RcnB family protein [Novosphingobium sp. YJ-S2-02]|uniref:RcnB family protein n=1 Tax=Novosphingobium aureum TaxID=2792964 RepID=A0A931MJQ9_9SPHN|nr:RcnB family protein [Novosphingobium aureum]MBH0111983.1 RcnB family protein [Novosphingobium aureum]
MKRFSATLLAAALVLPGLAGTGLTTSAMAAAPSHNAQHGQAQKHDNKASKKQASYKTFRKGEKFDKNRARNYAVVDYRKYKNVKAPPRGYRYVRSGDDLLLIGITSGIVASITSGMFR